MTQQNLAKRALRYVDRHLRAWTIPEARSLWRLRRLIGGMPRHRPGHVKVNGWDLGFVDAASCISAFDYIVLRKWLDFIPRTCRPRILDCGANIGISVLHYKRLFPEARITAFEPDPQICEVLRRNLRINGASDVEVIEAALWDSEGELEFACDGADGGHLNDVVGSDKNTLVRTQLLSGYLNEPIDLVKMDIEGAEGRVILEAGRCLHNVASISLEYHVVADRPQDLDSLLSTLSKSGFRYYVNSFGDWHSLTSGHAAPGLPFEQLLMISAKHNWKRDG